MDEKTKIDLKQAIDVLHYEDEKKNEDPSIKEREIKLFWERRCGDSIIWSLINTIANVLNQINNLINSKTEEERFMMTLYMIGSAVSLILLYLHSKKKYSPFKINLAYVVLVYVYIRTGIRLLDFEKTRMVMPQTKW